METRSRGGCFRWLKRIVLGFILFIVILLIAGAAYQEVSQRQDAEAYPPLGEMVDIGNLRLHLYCKGQGNPPVIFEAGAGNYSVYWLEVQDAIAENHQACVYDRAGLGWSEFSGMIPTSSQVAQNLQNLLEAAGIPAPYLLVGHSSGGLYIREFAEQYPDEVAGLVFVDSAHENQLNRMPPEFAALATTAPELEICRYLAPFGIMRLLGVAESLIVNEPIPAEMQEAAVASLNRTGFCPSYLNEQTAVFADSRQENPPESLGDIPIIVLSHGQSALDNPENLNPNIPLAVYEANEAEWQAMQREIAALSSNSEQLIVEDAGHMIQIDNPAVVIEAIERLLDTLEAGE